MDGTPANLSAFKMYQTDRERYNNAAKESCNLKLYDSKLESLYFKFCCCLRDGNREKKVLKYSSDVNRDNILMEEVFYPHDKLDKIFENLEKDLFTFIPLEVVKMYKKSKHLYSLIKAAENDIEQWAKEMIKSGDNHFVEDNFDFRICNNFENKQLWKSYFIFLRKFNPKKLLQMYSIYCRFFPDEIEMVVEYFEASQEFGPSLVRWNNPFEFEIFDENEILAPTFENIDNLFWIRVGPTRRRIISSNVSF